MNLKRSNFLSMTVWLKSFKFIGMALLDIILQYEAILGAASLE